jgi:4a-hydroxytetrahydrobiopterin dehydratase
MMRRFVAVGMSVSVGALIELQPSMILAVERLENEAIAQHLTLLPHWNLENSTLICTYEFENFVESVAFVNQLVAPAEAANHHPDVSIAYNRVTISLTTHDAGGLTLLDVDLAKDIEAIANPTGDRPCLPSD